MQLLVVPTFRRKTKIFSTLHIHENCATFDGFCLTCVWVWAPHQSVQLLGVMVRPPRSNALCVGLATTTRNFRKFGGRWVVGWSEKMWMNPPFNPSLIRRFVSVSYISTLISDYMIVLKKYKNCCN